MADLQRRVTKSGAVRWDVRYRDDARQQRKRSFERKLDAQRFARSVETDLLRGDWIDPRRGQELFEVWAVMWMETLASRKPKTRESYESIVASAKLLAFALASFIAGLGGALSAYRFGSVSAATFGSFASIGFLAFAYLGGISSVTGAIIGGMLVANGVMFTALDSWFGVDPAFTALLGGIGLIVTAVVHNEGMAGALTELRRPAMALARRRSVRPSSLPVALLTDDGVA